MASSEFARRQMEKHGWRKGAGLGKNQHGTCDPIKVTLKMDKSGLGHDPGKEFTDHWWLRVFNDAAKKVGYKDQTKMEKSTIEKKEKKKSFYAGFVKSSTLTNGIEEEIDMVDCSSSDENDSANNIPTLDDIHKFCGGATGHKAARFGIKMKGKLARIAEHDKKFEEIHKKLSSKKSSKSGSHEDITGPAPWNVDETMGHSEESQKETVRKENKKRKRKDESQSNCEESHQDVPSESKKRKKKRKSEPEENKIVYEMIDTSQSVVLDIDSRKRKGKSGEKNTNLLPDGSQKKKKKKTKRREHEDEMCEKNISKKKSNKRS